MKCCLPEKPLDIVFEDCGTTVDKVFIGWILHTRMFFLLRYPISFHMLSLLLRGCPISSFVTQSLSSENLKNYFPVSGLCFMSKLVEQVVAEQYNNHINIYGG